MSICKGLLACLDGNLEKMLALRHERSPKSDGTWVTAGDLLCERIVCEYLSSLHRPYVLLSEERPTPAVGDLMGFVVVLDPIDGTENFTCGLPEWGVGVSVYCEGAHVESLIALPEMGRALMTGDNVGDRMTSRLHGLSSSLKKSDYRKIPARQEYRIFGCCMYNMYNVIRGSLASFENTRGASVWDILPGLNLAIEHGLMVEVEGRPYDGRFLWPDKKYRFRVANK